MQFKQNKRAYTLVELLVVMLIMSIMAYVSLGALSSLSSSNGFQNNLSTFCHILQISRSYAMANNTYVYVGIQEVDGLASSTVVPQVAGTGTVAIAVIASKDGTNPPAAGLALAATNTNIVLPLARLNNLHISIPALAVANKPAGYAAVSTMLFANAVTTTPFTWPLGPAAQYNFVGGAAVASQVIMFNPQGSAQVDNAAGNITYNWIEIDLEPAHGNVVPAASANNAAILLDGVSGGVNLYRS